MRKTAFEYLEGVYTTIVLKDVAQRYQLIDPMRLENVTKFLLIISEIRYRSKDRRYAYF